MTRATSLPDTVTLHVPFHLVKRGGRKEMQLPEGTTQPRRADNTLIKALARAFRWKRMLETGEFATITELAEHEGIASSYMTRVLRLTLLAPEIVQTGLVAVWCRSFDSVMCSKGDEPWAQSGRMNFARMRCGSR